jgi:hypothetical protein
VLPQLALQLNGKNLVLTWSGPFILQSATSPEGPYTDVPGATSPYSCSAGPAPQLFFRLRSPASTVTATYLPNGTASLSVSGAPGYNYVVQVSTNGINWVNLTTNTAPSTFVDVNAAQYPGATYRAVTVQAAQGPAPSVSMAPQGQTLGWGDTAVLSVAASGAEPMTYQWQFNGNNIAGATASSLTLNNLRFTNAGLYSVEIGNPAGATVSPVAVLNVVPKLQTRLTGNNLSVSWPGPFVLQSAVNPQGPYSDMSSAISPCLIGTAGAPQKFFRLRSAPISATPSYLGNGQASVSVAGPPGCNIVLESSNDSVHWSSLKTNTAPYTFLDVNAAAQYRAAPAH